MTLLSRGEPSVFECVLRIQTTLASVTWPFTVLSVPLLMPTLPLRSGETCGDLLNFSGPQFLTCKISVMLLTSQGEGTTHRAGRPRHTALLCVSPLEGSSAFILLAMAPFSRPYCSSTTGLPQT